MLVLTRKLKERILIGDEIVLEVVRLEKGAVRLGISAPQGIIIRREEIAGRESNEDVKAA